MPSHKLHNNDCIPVLDTLAENSLDAIVTDPPYGLSNHDSADVAEALRAWLEGKPYTHSQAGFLGETWDAFVPGPEVWRRCYRALKPGGHILAFAGTRTVDLMGIALRLSGFEIRDSIAWMHGQGFPKSHNVSKHIDKKAGATREVIGRYESPEGTTGFNSRNDEYGFGVGDMNNRLITAPATEDAKKWDGFGTALKPSFEPILVGRKPFEGSVSDNVVRYGTGAMNIEACRIGNETAAVSSGRWPANVLITHNLDCKLVGTKKVKPNNGSGIHKGANRTAEKMGGYDGGWQKDTATTTFLESDGTETVQSWECTEGCQVQELDRQSGVTASGAMKPNQPRVASQGRGGYGQGMPDTASTQGYEASSGGASRFFYTAKASKNERTANGRVKNEHPTVKPIALMRYLCRLVTPPGGLVLDPFVGSGSTGVAALQEGFEFIGIERDLDSWKTAKGRCALALEPGLWDDPIEPVEEVPVVEMSLESILGFGK